MHRSHLSSWQALEAEETLALSYARDVTHRNEIIGDQIISGFINWPILTLKTRVRTTILSERSRSPRAVSGDQRNMYRIPKLGKIGI